MIEKLVWPVYFYLNSTHATSPNGKWMREEKKYKWKIWCQGAYDADFMLDGMIWRMTKIGYQLCIYYICRRLIVYNMLG